MRKLLIVDDEKNIRLGLKVMIERQFPERYDITLAADGIEAIERHREKLADIVITDIRMPDMDGLALIEHLAGEPRQPRLLILTGYDDFEYAKTAIRYQVKDYLLKPVRRDELFQAMERMEEEIERQERIEDRLSATDLIEEELRVSRLRDLLTNQRLTECEVEELGRQIRCGWLNHAYTIGVAAYVADDGKRMGKEELEVLFQRILRVPEYEGTFRFFDKDGRLVLVTDEKRPFTALAERMEAKGGASLLMGISELGSGIGQFRICYEQAREALAYTFVHPHANLIRYEAIKHKRLDFILPNEEIRKLANVLGTDREKEMQSLLRVIFNLNDLHQMHISYIRELSNRMNEQVLDQVFRIYGEASVEVLKLYRRVGSVENFRHFHDYFRSLEHLLFCLNDYVKQVHSAHSGNADMKAAVAYMETNYAKPLNMAVVSNYVCLNYSYFSEAFKAYTGENFVHYLKKVRIRKAKELLSDSSKKIADIGESVGFESVKQFARVFKELEGVSPLEYRLKVLTAEERARQQ